MACPKFLSSQHFQQIALASNMARCFFIQKLAIAKWPLLVNEISGISRG